MFWVRFQHVYNNTYEGTTSQFQCVILQMVHSLVRARQSEFEPPLLQLANDMGIFSTQNHSYSAMHHDVALNGTLKWQVHGIPIWKARCVPGYTAWTTPVKSTTQSAARKSEQDKKEKEAVEIKHQQSLVSGQDKQVNIKIWTAMSCLDVEASCGVRVAHFRPVRIQVHRA